MANIPKLGKLQQDILEFLVLHPDQHKDAIRSGLNYGTSNYAAILRSVGTLEKKGLIESSKKGERIQYYDLTTLGESCLFLTLDASKKPEVAEKLLERFSSHFPPETVERFKVIKKELGTPLTLKFFQFLSQVDIKPGIGSLMLAAFSASKFLTLEENKKIANVMLKLGSHPLWKKDSLEMIKQGFKQIFGKPLDNKAIMDILEEIKKEDDSNSGSS